MDKMTSATSPSVVVNIEKKFLPQENGTPLKEHRIGNGQGESAQKTKPQEEKETVNPNEVVRAMVHASGMPPPKQTAILSLLLQSISPDFDFVSFLQEEGYDADAFARWIYDKIGDPRITPNKYDILRMRAEAQRRTLTACILRALFAGGETDSLLCLL